MAAARDEEGDAAACDEGRGMCLVTLLVGSDLSEL
jgi:hypothetical protein